MKRVDVRPIMRFREIVMSLLLFSSLLILGAGIMSGLFGLGAKQAAKTGPSPFYNFAVKDAKHQVYDLNALKGKVYTVNTW
jgi:hypothetical protein